MNVDELVHKFQEHLDDIRSYTYNFNNWSRYMIIGNKNEKLLKDVEEILKHNYLYNLKLDIKLPKESIQEVQTVHSEQFFVPHRVKNTKRNQLVFTLLMHMFFKTMSKQYAMKVIVIKVFVGIGQTFVIMHQRPLSFLKKIYH